jgi:peroxiredoxin Q/BCP
MAKAKKKVVKKAVKKTAKAAGATKTKKTAKRPAKAAAKTSNKNLKNAKPALGAQVPALTLPATGGQEVSLANLRGKKVVLYFYPKDMTPGCTIEGHEFTRLKDKFAAANTVVYGISRDSVKSHEKFKEKECYTIDLLSDEDEKLCNALGVIKDKNMYGKIVRGIERSTFLVDESGRIIKEWRGVKAEGHAEQVLQALVEG